MGFEFKHYAFVTVIVCSLWAMAVSGLTSVEELGNIKLNSELPMEGERESNFGELPIANKFDSILKVMNIALPLALFSIIMLGMTYGTNPIGFGSMIFAIVIFLFACSKTLDAADMINASSEFSLDSRIWWTL